MTIPDAEKDAEKLNHSHIAGGNVNWYNHYRIEYGSFNQSKLYKVVFEYFSGVRRSGVVYLLFFDNIHTYRSVESVSQF